MYLNIIVLALIVIIGISAVIYRKKHPIDKKQKFPEGYFIATWMPLGIALGIPFGVAMGNIALGLPIGLAISTAVGLSLEAKMKKEGRIRPLTKKEKERKSKSVIIGLIMLALGVAVLTAMLFLR